MSRQQQYFFYKIQIRGNLLLKILLAHIFVDSIGYQGLNSTISHSGGEAPPHWATPAPHIGSKVCQILLPGQHLLPRCHLSPDCCFPGTSIHVPHPGKKATLLSPDKGAAKDPPVGADDGGQGPHSCTNTR